MALVDAKRVLFLFGCPSRGHKRGLSDNSLSSARRPDYGAEGRPGGGWGAIPYGVLPGQRPVSHQRGIQEGRARSEEGGHQQVATAG